MRWDSTFLVMMDDEGGVEVLRWRDGQCQTGLKTGGGVLRSRAGKRAAGSACRRPKKALTRGTPDVVPVSQVGAGDINRLPESTLG